MSQDVCSSPWHGVHGTTVTLKNHTKNQVSVSSNSSCTWPFPGETSPFTINAGATKAVVLADGSAKSYCYDTKGCPGDSKDVNPKTVIID